MTGIPLSDEELAALWLRYHQAADEGWLAVRPEGDRDLTAREFRRLLVEIEWRRAAAAELETELFRAFVAGFSVSRQNFNAEHPFYDLALDIETDSNIRQAFENWHRAESG